MNRKANNKDLLDKPGIVYIAKNKINGMVYIGQTIHSIRYRMNTHIRIAFSDKMRDRRKFFQNAINKYGIDNFDWHIITECYYRTDLDVAETAYILLYDSINKKNGYNLTLGKVYERNITTNNKMKLNRSKIDMNGRNNPMFGKKHSDKTKEKMRLKKANFIPWNKGKKTGELPKETKEKISASLLGNTRAKGKTPWNKGMKMK
jgi:group I intron endonuclease